MAIIQMYAAEMGQDDEDETARERNKERVLRTIDSLITNGVPEIITSGEDDNYQYDEDSNPIYRYSKANKNEYRYYYEYYPNGWVSKQRYIYTSTINGGTPYVSSLEHHFIYTKAGKLRSAATYIVERDTINIADPKNLRRTQTFSYNEKGLIDSITYEEGNNKTLHTIQYRDTLQTLYTIAQFQPYTGRYATQSKVFYTYDNKGNVAEQRTVRFANDTAANYEREVYTRSKFRNLPTQVLTYTSETGKAQDEWLYQQDLFFYGDRKEDAQTAGLARTSPPEQPQTPQPTTPPRPFTLPPSPPPVQPKSYGDPGVVETIPPPTQAPEPREQIFMYVEQMPEFPGGSGALRDFLDQNIQYPEKAKENGTQGRVIVKFVVRADGRITNAEIIRGIGDGCDEEALRVIGKMPLWKPGKQNGKAVDIFYTLPLTFQLD